MDCSPRTTLVTCVSRLKAQSYFYLCLTNIYIRKLRRSVPHTVEESTVNIILIRFHKFLTAQLNYIATPS